jgi:hypothetical protein
MNEFVTVLPFTALASLERAKACIITNVMTVQGQKNHYNMKLLKGQVFNLE